MVDDPDMARLVVLGDPGSGKSTLLRYLLLRWAEGGDESAPLPLLIELREYARLRAAGEANGFVHWLASGENARWHLGEAALGDWLDTWPSLVLFDGLDEVFDPTLRGEVTTAIHRFADEHPLARVVLTSRVIGYQHPTWRDNGFRHVMLEDLDEAHIAEFLTRWHERAYVDDPALGQRKRASLAGAIENSKAIAQLAGNPLLLTMMAIINRTQELPRDRVDLYEQCTRLLLYQWKADQAFVTDPELSRAHLDYRDKRDLMMRVAAAMQSSEGGLAGNFIDEATLEATLAEGLSGCADVRRERAARALIQQLRGRNFMLSSLGSGKYAFVHRTFLEYFAALAILDQFQAKQTLTREQLKEGIYGHWPDEVWHEVLCLLAAMLDAGVVAEVVEWLLAKPDDDYTCHHLFLAARCVGEVRSRAELGAVSQRVLERMQALTMVGVVLHMERRGAGWSVVRGLSCRAVEAVATVWRNEPSVLMWLRECAQSARGAEVRQSAVQELARGWKDDPETLAIVKARAQSDEYEDVRRTALEELARGWRDDPETLAIVKERAKSDDDTQVRECAVRALARGWTVDPETLVLVTTLVQSDDNAFVRRTALKELVHGWKRDPATPCILRASAQSDDDEFVRQGAVEELARGWREDPDALAIVEACAQHDEAWQVRQAAVLELACGWSADPATPDIIRGCAETDRSEWVREVALQEMARGWQRSPETAPWLKERAQWDLSGRVRKCAVQELARGWRRDPGTESWLKALAASEEDRAVWQGAVHGLARGWPGDVEAWAIVKSRALSDDDRWIRRSAAQELARGWRNTPQTAAVLRLIARSDGSAAVRESALEELAHGWHGDPETVALLAELERSDGDAGVRRIAAALRAFGPGTPAFGDSWPT